MSLIDDIPKREWFPSSSKDALTIQELQVETGEGRNWCEKLVRENVESGKWRMVWKKIKNRPVPAYTRNGRKK